MALFSSSLIRESDTILARNTQSYIMETAERAPVNKN